MYRSLVGVSRVVVPGAAAFQTRALGAELVDRLRGAEGAVWLVECLSRAGGV